MKKENFNFDRLKWLTLYVYLYSYNIITEST